MVHFDDAVGGRDMIGTLKKKSFKGKFKGKEGNGTKRPPPPSLPVLVFWKMDGQSAGRLPA